MKIYAIIQVLTTYLKKGLYHKDIFCLLFPFFFSCTKCAILQVFTIGFLTHIFLFNNKIIIIINKINEHLYVLINKHELVKL